MMPLPWIFVFCMIFFSFWTLQVYLSLFFLGGSSFLGSSFSTNKILPW